MSSENFDKNIKDSLEENIPVYEESSWHKMKDMLDKHLPQKKSDRRILILLIFFFLVAGSGIFILLNTKEPNELTVLPNKTASDVLEPESAKVTKSDQLNTGTSKEKDDVIATEPLKKQLENKKNYSLSEKKSSSSSIVANSVSQERKKAVNMQLIAIQKNAELVDEKYSANDKTDIRNSSTRKPIESEPAKKEITKVEMIAEENMVLPKEETLKPEENKLNENPLLDIKKSTKKNRKTLLQNFILSVSLGPDISSVGNNTGKVKIAFGAGVGYKISDHLTIRSGFYSVSKVYTADPKDYNPPSNFWTYYPNLKQIEADCKVYEIPLNVDYNFGKSKKQYWFLSAGVSSLIMKKEVYNYYFKPASSTQYVYYARSYENLNKHYFSLFNFSGGMSKKIGPNLRLQAEPYMRIAMKGVGYGKLKLNSGGILITASLTPFRK